MSMDFYLSREDQTKLREKLNRLPGVLKDLSVTETQQARIVKPGLGKIKHQQAGSRLPLNIEAAAAATDLEICLEHWVQFVCTGRKVRYTGPRNVIAHALWLKRNIVVLALIDGSQTAYKDINGRIIHCQNVVDLPPDDDLPEMDRRRVRAANKQVLTASQVVKVAARIGEGGKKLDAERIKMLTRNGHLRPVKVDRDTGTKFYRLGEVLRAHGAVATRNLPTRRRIRNV